MKPIFSHFAGAVMLSLVVSSSACAQTFDPAVQSDDSDDWLYAPLTPGSFEYHDEAGESLALFGDANPDHLFVLRCDKRSQMIGIALRGEISGEAAMTIRTEMQSQTMLAFQVPNRGLIAIELPASDPLFDAMAVTKGRFAVEVQGHGTLYIPPWGEAIRVIEDCR